MSTTYLFGSNSILARIDHLTSLGMDTKLDKALGFTKKDTEGPKLGDLSVQTSSYGVEIGRVHGTVAISGNLLWLENNLLKETAHKNKSSSGGKGGSASASADPDITYTYSATFAIGICEGPIDGVIRIWCGDKLIYNAGSADVATIIASNRAAQGFRLHLGTDDQLPDSRYQAAKGIGKTPSFRGLAYVVFDDFQLADYGNTLQAANFKFEVVQSSQTNNFRRLLGKTIAQHFQSSSVAGVGRPYVVSADGIIVVTTPTAQNYTYSLAGDLITATGSGPSLPDADRFFYYCGYAGGDLLKISSASGALLGAGPFITPGRYQAPLNPAHTLYGLSVSPNGQFVLAITAPPGSNYYETKPQGFFTLMDASGSVVKSGVINQSTDPFAFGFGPNAQFHFGANSIENDGNWFWFAYGAGDGNVQYWEITQGEMFYRGQLLRQIPDYIFTYPSILAADGMAYIVSGSSISIFTRTSQVLMAPPSLGEVIASEILASDLILAADIDTISLEPLVAGYAIQGGSIRSAIEPLQTLYQFDVIQSGYQAKFMPRGPGALAVIPWEDLVSSGSDDVVIAEEREMDTELPVKTTIKYIDNVREYSVSNQSFERLTTRAINKVDIEIPVVIGATDALATAEMLTLLPWLERSTYTFKLPPIYLGYEPADIIAIQTPWALLELRLTKVDYNDDGTMDCSAVPHQASIYNSEAVAVEPVPPVDTIALPGPSLFVPMDIPLISENLQSTPGFTAAVIGYAASWTGAVLLQTPDGGQTWKSLQAFTGMSTLGICAGTLPASASTLIDQRSIRVSMISGELESITRDQMLAGRHYVAYGSDGRWEIVRFQNASLNSDGSFTVSGFIRGEKGTEWATGTHLEGDYFVLLDDPDNLVINMPYDSTLMPMTYRAVTAGSDIDSAPDVPFTYKGVNLECLSPVYPKIRRSSGDVTLTVQRRSRLSSSWWASGIDAPVGETSLSLEADVMSGSTVKRTLRSSTGEFAYSAADQTTDFGAPQSSLAFRIYQVSSVVGRGYPLGVTL